MVEEAETLGADAVVMVRFQTVEMMRGAAEMLCYGTAVRLDATEARLTFLEGAVRE